VGWDAGGGYGSFPISNPPGNPGYPISVNWVSGASTNYGQVNEIPEDGDGTYVYDATIGEADFYTISPLDGTPAATIGVVTRGLARKSDAGTRLGEVRLNSHGNISTSPLTPLSSSWAWLYVVDLTDPYTAAAWTAAAVDAAQIGPFVAG
jgi:hypothetical protein